MIEIVDTERKYVDSLRGVVNGYLKPLRQSPILDPKQVDLSSFFKHEMETKNRISF